MATQAEWDIIERWMILHDDFPACAKEFNMKEDTVRKRARRYAWPLPSVIAKRAAEIRALPNVQPARNGALIEQSAKTLAEKGEEHANTMFDLAAGAIAAVKKLPIKNWRDAEIADKAARRSAGMGNDDEGVKISLIQLNEAIDTHSDEDVIEGEVLPGDPATSLPDTGLPNDRVPALQDRQPAE